MVKISLSFSFLCLFPCVLSMSERMQRYHMPLCVCDLLLTTQSNYYVNWIVWFVNRIERRHAWERKRNERTHNQVYHMQIIEVNFVVGRINICLFSLTQSLTHWFWLVQSYTQTCVHVRMCLCARERSNSSIHTDFAYSLLIWYSLMLIFGQYSTSHYVYSFYTRHAFTVFNASTYSISSDRICGRQFVKRSMNSKSIGKFNKLVL